MGSEGGCSILAIITILLYIVMGLLAIATSVALLLLLVPINYRLDGGFEKGWRVGFRLRCSPLLAAGGNWDHRRDRPLQARVVIAGLPFNLQPEKWGKDSPPGPEEEKEKPSFGFFVRNMDGQLLALARDLLVDLLKFLWPRRLELEGKIGFDEPHLTGWLAALLHLAGGDERFRRLKLEPAWEEEHCEFRFLVEGALCAGLILFRMARFMLAGRMRRLWKELRRLKASRADRLTPLGGDTSAGQGQLHQPGRRGIRTDIIYD